MVNYLPTILMNIINQLTNYIRGDSKYDLNVTVNITSMMVLASIYLSVSSSLPSSSTIKPVEVWLLFNLAYPFLVIFVNIILQVGIFWNDSYIQNTIPLCRGSQNQYLEAEKERTRSRKDKSLSYRYLLSSLTQLVMFYFVPPTLFILRESSTSRYQYYSYITFSHLLFNVTPKHF